MLILLVQYQQQQPPIYSKTWPLGVASALIKGWVPHDFPLAVQCWYYQQQPHIYSASCLYIPPEKKKQYGWLKTALTDGNNYDGWLKITLTEKNIRWLTENNADRTNFRMADWKQRWPDKNPYGWLKITLIEQKKHNGWLKTTLTKQKQDGCLKQYPKVKL